MNKLIAICGPTSTGKTSLAVKLCKEFNGEIVSADSRQIYKFMDIGTGKLPLAREGVKIHLYDVVEPDESFSAADFSKLARSTITDIQNRGKIPFLVGGTGFYLAAVLGEVGLAGVEPDWGLRSQLERLSMEELFERLQEISPQRAKTIDRRNKRRLIRAIEVAESQKDSENSENQNVRESDKSDVSDTLTHRGTDALSHSEFSDNLISPLKIGLTAPRKILYQRADAWVEAIVNDGLINEVQDLINRGYRDTPPMKGIIYQTAVAHLDGKLSKEDMLKRIKFDLHGYIRRQLTWFRKDKKIHWFDISQVGFDKEVEKLVKSFLR